MHLISMKLSYKVIEQQHLLSTFLLGYTSQEKMKGFSTHSFLIKKLHPFVVLPLQTDPLR